MKKFILAFALFPLSSAAQASLINHAAAAAIAVGEWTGVGNPVTVDKTAAGVYNGFSSSCTPTATGTTANANDLILGYIFQASTGTTISAASGYTIPTNASTGTCVVSTTAVTANSRIFVQPSSAEGANLSVTCNTTADTGLTAPRLSAKSAGTSFTINLGTFSTNPLCFNYWIEN